MKSPDNHGLVAAVPIEVVPAAGSGRYGSAGRSVKHIDIINEPHHDDSMRTTLTLEPDVAQRVRQQMRRTGKGLKAVVNEALRLGLGIREKPMRPPRFKVQAHAFGFRPGIDLDRLNQLVDELEAGETARGLQR